MLPSLTRACIIVAAILFYPPTLWASRGSDDYGIAGALLGILYALPVGITLICFIIDQAVKLAKLKRKMPPKQQGVVVFILSMIIIAFSTAAPLGLAYSARWHRVMIEVMAGVFVPVLLLAAVAAALATLLKKRSQAAGTQSSPSAKTIAS